VDAKLAKESKREMTPAAKVTYLSALLEHFHKLYSVFGAKKIAFAIGGGNGFEGRFRG